MPTSYESALGADAPDTVGTAFQIGVGSWAHGSIESPTDADFIAVTLVVGQTYSFAMAGISASNLTDPLLHLFAGDGTTLLAQDDNGLANGNARFSFTAAASGTHYLRASGVAGETGAYAVAATLGALASLDAAMAAGLLDGHLSWSATRGTGASLSFGFSDTITHGLANFTAFTDGQKDTTRAVLAQFSEVSGLVFTEVAPGGLTDDATLLYGNYSAADGLAAQSWGPAITTFGDRSGDVWINTATPPETASAPGSDAHFLMLHQLAITLGLTAPGIYPSGSLTFATHAAHIHDSQQFTILSPFSAADTGASALTPDTLGPHDIAALQLLYGANTTTRAGATTYGFGSDAGEVYDFAVNLDPMLTIWDGGGIDHLNASLYSAAQLIDLTAGAQSDIGGFSGNVSIAYGTVIEQATGGRGADQIIGNAAANLLAGGGGDDSLTGGDGNDTLMGGSGGDTLIGGAGNDSLIGGDAGPAPPAPSSFVLTTTDGAAGAYVHATGINLFPASSFTLEFIWQQTSLANEGYVVEFGNLRIFRHADGSASLEFADAYGEPWLQGALPPAMTDGDPHRISITYDDGTGRLMIFLDGVCTRAHDFIVGTRNLWPVGDVSFEDAAAVGDIRLYDYALMPSDIWTTSWAPLPDPESTTGLLNYWVGDGFGGLTNLLTAFPDLTATGPTGSLTTPLQVETTINRMEGGLGNDDYVIRSSLDLVFEALNAGTDRLFAHVDYSLATGQHVEQLFAAAGGGGIALTGNSFANRLTSSADSADTLAGAAGSDSYYIYHADDQVIEAAAQGVDYVYAYTDFTLAAGSSVEHLRALGPVGVALTGNALANRFYSNALLADTLSGGLGNDIYFVYNAGDRVIEGASGGVDRIYAYANHTLAANSEVENLQAIGTAGRNLIGNALANRFYSNAAHADTMAGGLGNDIYYVKNSDDRVNEGLDGGTDTVYSNVTFKLSATSHIEYLRVSGSVGQALTGNGFTNRIYGSVGQDTLEGGGGQDFLYGGAGSAADRFVFRAISDSAVGSGRDFVYGFVSGVDKIDLGLIDANTTVTGNQTFAFSASGPAAFSVWLTVSGPRLLVQADVTGDGVADTEIALDGLSTALATDFIL